MRFLEDTMHLRGGTDLSFEEAFLDSIALLLLYCCSTASLLLLYCCFTCHEVFGRLFILAVMFKFRLKRDFIDTHTQTHTHTHIHVYNYTYTYIHIYMVYIYI